MHYARAQSTLSHASDFRPARQNAVNQSAGLVRGARMRHQAGRLFHYREFFRVIDHLEFHGIIRRDTDLANRLKLS